MTRADFLEGRRVERVEERPDDEGHTWTVIMLDDGNEVHILDETAWVLVDAERH